MTLDFTSHPSDLVTGGTVDGKLTTVKDLRNAIPKHCWAPSIWRSLGYLLRDFAVASALAYLAYTYIPQIGIPAIRYIAWLTYGFVQGLQLTGIWVIGHECGHSNFSKSSLINDTVGWLLHSFLLTPYFSWQSTHRRHHIYANNLAKDHNYVPPQRENYAAMLNVDTEFLEELAEDTPLFTTLRIIVQQVFGFPWYLLTNITASEGSLHRPQSHNLDNSHFLPSSTLFRPEEAPYILLSDLGIILMGACLWMVGKAIGGSNVLLLYLHPYMWVNHWIVTITYLHHTHPNVPKYEPEAWTFLRGALATVDREFGFIGKHMMHNIIEFHVIHHLFSRIPQYHAEEATKAIIPLLGSSYRSDKEKGIWYGIWESFTRCQWVEPDKPDAKPADRVMVYKGGPSPPIERHMILKNRML